MPGGSRCKAIVTQLRMDVERGLRSLSLAILDSRCDSAKVMAICVFQNSKICKMRVSFLFLEAGSLKL